MCHADVAPIPWRINFPANKVIVPRLATTHTCRDWSARYDAVAVQSRELMQ